MLKTEAIKAFLKAKTHFDLATLYSHDMEVQVNVGRDNGTAIEEGDFRGKASRAWTDGITIWKPIRIPHSASSDPKYTDTPVKFDINEHAEGIGLTGWDWKNRVSKWVAFDFDAITGHSDRHQKKLTDSQLFEVQEVVKTLPWTTLRRSTSGKGLHVYVFLNDVPTANHTEHAALARSILGMMSGMTGFDFSNTVDVSGQILWFWHRKMIGTNGLTLLKQGTVLTNVPGNWRDHVPVITRKSKKASPQFVQQLDVADPDTLFAELTGQRAKVQLDADHKKLIEFLGSSNAAWWWDNDNWMLVCHTFDLKQAHIALKMKGRFDTISEGKDHGIDHNAFAFPLRHGAWAIRRYAMGVKEHDSWEQDGKGWTRCFLNREADLGTVARLYDGVESEKGDYVFKDVESMMKALVELKVDFGELPPWIHNNRKATVKPMHQEGKVLITIEGQDTDDHTKMSKWIYEKKKFKRIFNISLPKSSETDSSENYDDVIRHIVSEIGNDMGWIVRRDGAWSEEPLVHIRTLLMSYGHDQEVVTSILGKSIASPWKIVNKPFQSEYPGDREWNRGAPQFAVPPTQETEALSYPNWLKVLNHCGKNLNEYIKDLDWCKANGIANGADYLKLWLSCLIKRPDQPSPYLAFWGNQDCGKSIFHEMLHLIINGGLMPGDAALTSSSGFNGEFQNALVCYVEETDLKKNKIAYNRIKDWVTSPHILLHVKRETPITVKNYLHFIQTTNERDSIPVFPGDSRITMIHVDDISKEDMVGKRQLMELLRKEAPDFLAALLLLEIPEFNDRLIMPIIQTQDKVEAEERNMNLLEEFIKRECYNIPGAVVDCNIFHERFQEWLSPTDKNYWTKNQIGRQLPSKFPRGKLSTNPIQHFGNISFDHDHPLGVELVTKGVYLKPKDQ